MIKSLATDTLKKFDNIKAALKKPVEIGIFSTSEDEALNVGKLISAQSDKKTGVRLLDMNKLGEEHFELHVYDLMIFVFDTNFDEQELVRKFTRRLEFLEHDFVTLISGIDLETNMELVIKKVMEATGKNVDDISLVNIELEINLDDFAEKCLTVIDYSKKMLLGYNFPFFRGYCANNIIQSTARQNGLASMGLFFTPAVGMGVLTANQIKMVLELAALYRQDLDAKRIKEVLATLGVGYGARGIAKSLLQALPIPAVPVKGAIAYSITLGLGKAAKEYFESEGLKEIREFDPLSLIKH